MPTELRKLDINELALVKRGANKKRTMLFKSVDTETIDKAQHAHASINISFSVDPFSQEKMSKEDMDKIKNLMRTLTALMNSANLAKDDESKPDDEGEGKPADDGKPAEEKPDADETQELDEETQEAAQAAMDNLEQVSESLAANPDDPALIEAAEAAHAQVGEFVEELQGTKEEN